MKRIKKIKLKTHRGMRKRAKVTKNGKVLVKSAGLRHNLTKRSSKSKRQKRGLKTLPGLEAKRVKRMLPYA